MPQLLQLFILLPLVGFFISLLLPRKNERVIAGLAIGVAVLHLLGAIAFIGYWLLNDYPVLDVKQLTVYQTEHLEIFVDFYFDKATAVFAFVGSLLTLLVALFSRSYLHRDEGYKRFFSTLLLFVIGYNLLIFSGNFETLFVGWEFLGICSFLLIAFYRDRYLPVKNALKVISVYRLGDICLILAMWMSHQLWHQNITFAQLNDAGLVSSHWQEAGNYAFFIALMIVMAAAIKSAQLPFSSWLPRAMEGPTTSSAIFYGSLSVHLGVFLLLRTYPYWGDVLGIKILIIAIGVGTSMIAASIARVQSTVKTQIAYSSITQIGLMFIEVALGWHVLALIHFAGNAFLRTYQLLVSPSVLSYLIHNMVFYFTPKKEVRQSRLMNSLYILSVKEWNLDGFLHKTLWSPFKWIGKQTRSLSNAIALLLLAILLAAGVYFYFVTDQSNDFTATYLPFALAIVALMLILGSFAERQNAKRAWLFIMGAQVLITLSIGLLHEEFSATYMLMYLSGAILASIIGYACLAKIASSEKDIDLNRFHGHVYEYPGTAALFLIACLASAGLPFTPTFIGIDLLFSHVGKSEYFFIMLMAISFVFIELAALRIYARIFLGQHKKQYHPIAYRSS
ncbi:MAG: hypothetical protein JWP69_180 [Flaviaesturariibacter sp.]|nr:hypothetical protein [Flaviaesturariibacter sp.]